ncbi:MAG: NADH-quinone oxidoreductase subunit J [Allobranchiibius sp.]
MFVDIVFWAMTVLAVAMGAAVFVVDSMARATYALALSFVAVGVQVLLLHQDYVGVIVILMMVMEMAIMAVYMIMFMGMNPALMPMSMVHDNRKAVAAAATLFITLGAGALLIPWPSRRGAPSGDTTRALGEALMGSKMLVMTAVSPVMVATIVAGITIASKRGRYDRLGDDLRGAPDDPQRGGVGK